jgi:hypothetical protein
LHTNMNASKHAAVLGKLGGKVKSKAKTIACRKNAARPRRRK